MRDTIDITREAWAKAGEGWVDQHWYADREKAFKAFEALVRADEREACAKLVFNSPPSDEYESPLRAVYNAIRARGNP